MAVEAENALRELGRERRQWLAGDPDRLNDPGVRDRAGGQQPGSGECSEAEGDLRAVSASKRKGEGGDRQRPCRRGKVAGGDDDRGDPAQHAAGQQDRRSVGAERVRQRWDEPDQEDRFGQSEEQAGGHDSSPRASHEGSDALADRRAEEQQRGCRNRERDTPRTADL